MRARERSWSARRARRAQQLADTALRDYHATAHGYLTFLAQVGEGFPDPPKVVKADELALEVYWRAPNLSKQRIVGRRDTLAAAHRHRVPPRPPRHRPEQLSRASSASARAMRCATCRTRCPRRGCATTTSRSRDSLRIRLPGRTFGCTSCAFGRRRSRSRGSSARSTSIAPTAQVVRMAFTFTRPAYLDKELEDISIVLENALVQERFWLPLPPGGRDPAHRDVARLSGARDHPRAMGDLATTRSTPGCRSPFFTAVPEIVSAPARELAQHEWHGRILDSLPSDVRAASDADVRKVQEEARALVQQQALARARGRVAVGAQGISDFVRVNRVEGLALGAGASVARGRRRRALAARALRILRSRAQGPTRRRASARRRHRDRAFGVRDYRDVGDVAERSTAVNSFAAQEFGERRHRSVRCMGGGRRRGARRCTADCAGGWKARGSIRTRSAFTRAPRGEATSARFPRARCTRSDSCSIHSPGSRDVRRVRDAIRGTASRRT